MKHEHTPTDETTYGLYQYCECGATRKNQRGEEWHICDICRVGGAEDNA